MPIGIEALGAATVVTIAGEVDLAVEEPLRDALDRACDAGTQVVVVDLTATTFMDSTALGALVDAHRRLEARGGRMRVVAPQGAVRRVLELTALVGPLGVVERRDEALGDLDDERPGP
ncbi:MAG TPA: STAS domain-containing protein [Solirubrobacteraceae bacterium]|nr:STAS domain-containing protein [Solirubrobacteraceae bacterium]